MFDFVNIHFFLLAYLTCICCVHVRPNHKLLLQSKGPLSRANLGSFVLYAEPNYQGSCGIKKGLFMTF